MPITQEQREQRKHFLGSSDMAAVLGVSPWKTGYDVWLEKTGRLVDVEVEENPAMKAGNVFENGVLDAAEERYGHLLRNHRAVCPGTHIAANIDAVVEADRVPVEAKTVGLFWKTNEWWGDEGTDQVPDRVLIQCHVHLLCLGNGAEVCHVPAFIGGRGFVFFEVPKKEDLLKIIRERGERFWTEHVMANTPPKDSKASLEVVKRIRRQPESVANVDPALVDTWNDAKEAAKIADTAENDAKTAVLQALGEAEAGLCGELGAVIYFEQSRRAYEVKETTFRVLRHKTKGL